jgi:allophanate hydrolase subunit 2
MGLRVIRPGLFSLLVDLGRPDRRELGMPVGGAADQAALRLGNALLGNEPHALALEITLIGPDLQADADLAGVVFGPNTQVWINDQSWPVGTTFQLQRGDCLGVGAVRQGARAYFCVAGGFAAPLRLGSRSALAPLVQGATLACSASRQRPRRRIAEAWRDPDVYTLGLLPGSHLTAELSGIIEQETFVVTDECNRQGVRFQGAAELPAVGMEITSAPVAPGTVQLTGGRQLIALGVDAQSIGGYPRVAHVIRSDLDKLGQLRPQAAVRFHWVELAQAEAAWREQDARVRTLEAWLRAGAQM